MSDEIKNTNHINLKSINEESECNHHHNHNHNDEEENKEGNSIITFALGDEKHPIDEEDEVIIILLPMC